MHIRKLIFLVALFLQVVFVKAQNPNMVRVPWGTPVTLGVDDPSGNYTYQWYRDGFAIANARAATYHATTAGVYNVRAINQGNCESDLSEDFIVFFQYADMQVIKKSEVRYVGPNETFEYRIYARNNGNTDNTNVVVTDQLPTNLIYEAIESTSIGTASYNQGVITWNIPSFPVSTTQDGEVLVIKAKGKMPGMVLNKAVISGDLPDIDMANNTSTDTKKIIGNIKVPNVITPNGDGKNDVFKVEGIELYKENTLSIFNRWGNEVFRSTGGYRNNWNGDGLST